MPYIEHSDYQPPYWLFNGHLQTIVPSQFRNVTGINYHRERLSTPDDDFLLLDWSAHGSDNLVIISHGLEGDSQRAYIMGMARAFNRAGWDALAWNFRGCGGEINHTLRFYHSGATDDLHLVLEHVLAKKKYQRIVLIGFSLGGNLTLKYLGESVEKLTPEIKAAAVFSVPLDLYTCAEQISSPSNFIYSHRFLRNLKRKISQKVLNMPDKLSIAYFSKIKSLKDFDDFYTAPLHGFKDAIDYYTHCSSLHYLKEIHIPTLLVNAQNDPFLSDKCYPVDLLREHPFVYLEIPETGGHVGFMPKGAKADDNYWAEKRALEFVQQSLRKK